jgi:hypothetical protein
MLFSPSDADQYPHAGRGVGLPIRVVISERNDPLATH